MSDTTTSTAEYRKAQRASKLELAFETQLRQLFMDHGWDYGAVEREYQFCPDRKWRADFAIDGVLAFPYTKALSNVLFGGRMGPYRYHPTLLIEIEGGTRRGGRHNRHDGFTNDAYKYSAAAAMGFTLLRGTSQMVNDGTLLMMVEQTLTGKPNFKDWKTT